MSVVVPLSSLSAEHIKAIQEHLTMIPVDPNEEKQKFWKGRPKVMAKPKSTVLMFKTSEDEQFISLPYRYACCLFNKIFNHDRPHVQIIKDMTPKFEVTLREEQIPVAQEAYQQLRKYSTTTLGVPPGFGKCLHPDTPILNAFGGITLAKDIKVGDFLIGDDSTTRRVLSICEGEENMYEIIPTRGRSFICNEPHILTLKGIVPYVKLATRGIKRFQAVYSINGDGKSKGFATEDEAKEFIATLPEDIFDIPLNEYMLKNKTFKAKTYLFHAPVNFNPQSIPFDPYMLGYWLGDGTSRFSQITTTDEEVLQYFRENLPLYGLRFGSSNKITYTIVGDGENYGKYRGNAMRNTLADMNLYQNKHIPTEYRLNSREVRLKLLAGLVDSDGYNANNCLEIVQKSEKLADDIEYLCFSLGFMVTKTKCEKSCIYNGEIRTGEYFRLIIYGEGLEDIPTLLPRKKFHKRGQVKRATCVGFTVKPLGKGKYCGFTLDGNGRFLLGDFKVTHNTMLSIFLAYLAGYCTLILCNRDTIMRQWLATIYKCIPAYTSYVWMVGESAPPNDGSIPAFIICMDERFSKIPEYIRNAVGTLVVDEAHMFCTPSQVPCLLDTQPRYVILCSATLERDDGMQQMVQAVAGPHGVFKVSEVPYFILKIKTHIQVDTTRNRFGVNYDSLCKGLAASDTRNNIVIDIVKSNPHRKFILLSKLADHVELLQLLMEKAGVRASTLYRSQKKYSDALALIGTMPKMGTGFDEENACEDFQGKKSDVLILLHSVKKWQQYEQFRGRVMRANNPIVIWMYDAMETTRRHFRELQDWFTQTNGNVVDVDYSPGTIILPENPQVIKVDVPPVTETPRPFPPKVEHPLPVGGDGHTTTLPGVRAFPPPINK